MRRLVVFSICLALVAVGCGSGETAETTMGSESTTTSAECPPTVSKSTTTESVGEEGLEETHFAYMSGLVVVPTAELDVTRPLLEEMGIDEEVTLDEVLGSIDAKQAGEEVQAARRMLAEMVQIFSVGGDDPLAVAGDIRAMAEEGGSSEELRIAPIHAIGEAGHSGYQAGTDPDPQEGISIDPPEGSRATVEKDLAAVVDSGIYPDAPWLDGSVEYMDPLDIEPPGGDGHSHGTFVSSIIRQLSPEHRITFARARRVPIGELAWSDGDPGTTELTELSTEIHVAEAILRLVQRHQNEKGRVKSLNLSLGGYSLTTGQDIWMTTTADAIDHWLQTFPDACVFAAAGNATALQSFWPAALGNVTGVGALNDPSTGSPVEIVWDHQNHNEVPWSNLSTTPRASTNQLAPGSMIVNYTQPEVVAHWSGSSFAAAVANGLHLNGTTSIPLTRSEIPDLTYWTGSSVAIGTGP